MLDLKLGGVDVAAPPRAQAAELPRTQAAPLPRTQAGMLPRAEQELVDDSLRVIALSLEQRQGAAALEAHLRSDFHPSQGDDTAASRWLVEHAALAPPVRAAR